MTTIKTTCPDCGDVMMGIEELHLELTPNETNGAYRFDCPLCSQARSRTAGPRVVMVLLAAGVSYGITGYDTITEDEIKAFMQALETETNPVRLLGA